MNTTYTATSRATRDMSSLGRGDIAVRGQHKASLVTVFRSIHLFTFLAFLFTLGYC